MKCPCGSGQDFIQCCEPYLTGIASPPTAEALMRSRYTAYTKADIDYLKKTLAPSSRHDFDPVSTKKWAINARWKGLRILSVDKGTENDKKGTVEFLATYEQDGEGLEHHEVSNFVKSEGQWYFVDGEGHSHKEGEGHHHHHPKPQTVVREGPKVGRNDPCPCGSGKKYKKCHGLTAD